MAVETFKKYITDLSLKDITVMESDKPTHTAQEAADVHGVPVSNIVKSLLVALSSLGESVNNRYVLVLVPGNIRLDLESLAIKLEQDARMASADEVKKITGYSIGGVPPLGHTSKLETYIVKGFDREISLIAAAGSANSVFRIDYHRLVAITSAHILDI